MATWVGKPDAGAFPIGTTVHLYPKPVTPWTESGKPPGSETTSAAVATDGTLTFAGLTEGHRYLGWSERSGVSYYLNLSVPEAEAGAGVTSVNSKTGAVTLSAEDVGAVGTESPTFTGTPAAPTATALTKTTQLATTAFTTDAVAVEKSGRETADAAKAPLASPALTGAPTAPTATALTATTQLATTAYADAATKVEKERAEAVEVLKAALASPALTGTPTAPTAAALTSTTQLATTAFATSGTTVEKERAEAAEVLKALKLAVHAEVATNGTTATVNQLHPVNDEAETRTIKLPTGQAAGSIVFIEKSSAEAHEVEVEGNMRGVAAQTIKLRLSKQVVGFLADASGSWWPVFFFTPLATLTTTYIQRTIAIPPGTVPPNELLAEWKYEPQGTEKQTLIKARIRTSSGTINVAIKRGEAGTTEIVAYKELKGASTEEVVTSEQALTAKDRITVTASGGSSAKGLFVDLWFKVEK